MEKKTSSDISFRPVSFRALFYLRDRVRDFVPHAYNHIFMWARELMRSRTKYRLESCEISYEISFGDFARFRTRYRLVFCEISYKISFGILRDLGILNKFNSIQFNSIQFFICTIHFTDKIEKIT